MCEGFSSSLPHTYVLRRACNADRGICGFHQRPLVATFSLAISPIPYVRVYLVSPGLPGSVSKQRFFIALVSAGHHSKSDHFSSTTTEGDIREMGKQQKQAPTNRKADKAKAGKRSGNVRKASGVKVYRGTPQELQAYSNVILLERKIDDCMGGLMNLVLHAPTLSAETYHHLIMTIRYEDVPYDFFDSEMPLYEQAFILDKVDGLKRLVQALKVQSIRAGKLVNVNERAA